MLLTLKSNKYKPGLVHLMLALSLQICLTKNSTLEPVMAIYAQPLLRGQPLRELVHAGE